MFVIINLHTPGLFQGDMNQKEKNCVKFEKHISERKDAYEPIQKKRKEEVSELKAEVEQIQQIIQVGNLL